LDISNFEDWMLYYGYWDSPLDSLLGLIRPGHVIMDIGCNIGATILPMARLAGETGLVYGFEPDPDTMKNCARNVSLNDLKNIRLHAMALSDLEGTAALRRGEPRNPAANRIVAEAAPDDIAVDTTTLDSFVESAGLERLNLLKIDVEGHEARVLRGAAKAIRRFQPDMFIEAIDSHLNSSGSSRMELLGMIAGMDYRIADAASGQSVDPTTGAGLTGSDIIARPAASRRHPA
jgi:FkbM family methyltransferase